MDNNLVTDVVDQVTALQSVGECCYNLRFVIDRENFLHAIVRVSGIVERRSVLPVLSSVKIKASDGKISLSTTDMDISILSSIDAEVLLPGEVSVSAHVLHDIIKKLPSGLSVEIFCENTNKLQIVCDKSSFSIPIIESDWFQDIAETNNFDSEFEISSSIMIELLSKTKFAMSLEDTRSHLNGVHLSARGGVLDGVATDCNRLSYVNFSDITNLPNFGITIPRKTVTEIYKLLNDNKKSIIIKLSDKKILFGYENNLLVSKLIDSAFPNYEEAIPQNNNKIMKVDAALLANAIDRVSVVISDRVKAIRFSLTKNQLQLSAISHDSSDAKELLEVLYEFDEELEVSLNARYILDVLNEVKGMCEISFSDRLSGIKISDLSFLNSIYVIMPLRIGDY